MTAKTPSIITSITLDTEHIRKLLAVAAGCRVCDVCLTGDAPVAQIDTDFRGAERVRRALAKPDTDSTATSEAAS